MKRIFKNKFIACIIAAAVALFAAVFAISNTKDKGQTVTAQAEMPVTKDIYWGVSGNENDYTLTISSIGLSSSYKTVDSGSFTGSTCFDYTWTAAWSNYSQKITTVNIYTKIAPEYTRYWFYDMSNLTKIINLSDIDTSNVIDMRYMFFNCRGLTTLNLTSFVTHKVTNMEMMFGACVGFTSIELPTNFVTSNVTNLRRTFSACINVTSFDFSDWVVADNADLTDVFMGLNSLEQITLSESLVKRMSETAFFKADSVWYDNDGNEYTADSPMTVKGTYYSQMPVCEHTNLTAHPQVTYCDKQGNEAYWECLECGSLFSDSEANNEIDEIITISATGHSFSKDWSSDKDNHWHAATCEHTTEKKDLAAHDWNDGETTTPATCKAEGVYTYTCTVCNATKTESIPKEEHAWGNWVEKTPATCTADKKEEHTCSKCANKEEQTVAGTMLGHLYGAPTWDWTADYSSATAKFTCTREGCGDKRNLPGTVTTSTTAATCMAAGKTTYTATLAVTGAEFPQSTYTDTQEVPITQLNHIAATTWSKDSGNHWHECTRDCGTKLDEAAHEYTIWKVDTAATVTSAGVGHHECVCGAKGADEEIPMETCSHTNKSHVPAVEATCMAAGNPEYWTCGDCGKNLDGTNTEISTIVTPVDPDNHKAWGDWQPETAATCTEKGSEKRVCADCHIGEETRETAIAPDAHDIEHHEAKTANCTEAGWGEYDTCSRCEYTTKTEIPALDHNWANEWSKDETNHWHICSRCDEINDNADHTYEWVITTPATTEEAGLMENLCSVCGQKDGEQEIAKLDDGSGNEIDLPVDIDVEFKVTQSSTGNDYSDIDKGLKRGYWAQLWYRNGDGTLGAPFTDKMNCFLTLKIPTEIIEAIRGGEEIDRDKIAEGLSVYYYVDGERFDVENFKIVQKEDESWIVKFNYNEKFSAEIVFAADVEESGSEPAAGIPWWVWLIVGLVAVAIVGVVIIIIVVIKKKNNGDGGAVVAAADNGEVLDKLAKQDEKIDRLIEITDGGFNDFVDEE